MAIKNGEAGSADEVMNALGSIFNDTAQNLFNAAYIGFDSSLNNTGVPSYDNVSYSIFESDDADVNFGFEYDTTDDLYQTIDISGITEYIIVEATSYTGWTNGTNDTYVLQISSGKWLIYCDTGTDAVKRAQIHKSLWYGTDGSDQLILDFTTVTAIKSSNANDVGKQAYYATSSANDDGSNSNSLYTGTFSDTSTNTDCSSWALARGGWTTSNPAIYGRWEIATGTVRLSAEAGPGQPISDEMGTDTSGDEVDNPATCALRCVDGAPTDGPSYATVIMLCSGDVSWVLTGTNSYSGSDIDFKNDNSIPDITAAGSLSTEGALASTLIFKTTASESVTNAIPIINSTIDATSSQQISVSADSGSNWTNVNNAEIARPTAGTGLWRRITITRTDASKIDTVTEQAVKYNLY